MVSKRLIDPKAIDMECLMSTKEGTLSRDPAMIEMLAAYFKTAGLRIKTDDEMAQDWRDAGVPIKITVGATAGGAGQGGDQISGMGIRLSSEKPIPNVGDVAAAFPNPTIVGHHYPFPWVDEMTAVMIHKNNVYCEVHGWRPKYFHDNFKRELNTRIKGKIMFGSDYPFFPYDKLFTDWEAGDYKPEVLQNVYINTARKVLWPAK